MRCFRKTESGVRAEGRCRTRAWANGTWIRSYLVGVWKNGGELFCEPKNATPCGYFPSFSFDFNTYPPSPSALKSLLNTSSALSTSLPFSSNATITRSGFFVQL